ncbi:hypothetical protein [Streptomyces sp. G45]|uniref:hypothetical protein n=1 Tax=Streptomyces sp. G45 TaxID=3406627 RepID=UPI003C179C1B
MTQPPQQWPGGGFGPPQPPYGSARGPYGSPPGQPGHQGPVADNPYAGPVPYGGGHPSPPGGGGGGRRRRTGLIAGAAALALAVVAGGVWLAVGRDDDGAEPEAGPTPRQSASAGADTPSPDEAEDPQGSEDPEDPEASDSPEESPTPDEPDSGPTGTTLVGLWRSEEPGGGLLGLRDSPDTAKPRKISVSLLDDGRCTGVRRVIEPGRSYRIGLLCERTKKEIYGDLIFPGGDTLTITWDRGRSGKDTYKRFADWPQDGRDTGGSGGSGGTSDSEDTEGVEGV